MLNQTKKFKGGYRFKKAEGVYSDVIKTASIPSKVTLPLKLRFGSTLTPLVKKGDKVRAGQIIARNDDNISAPAVASVNGTVVDIKPIEYYYGKVEAVVIESDGSSDFISVEGSASDFERLSFEKISELIYISGAASLGKSGIPTIYKSSPARPNSIENLIITTFGTDPFSLNERILLKGKEQEFYNGIIILKKALPNVKVTIAVDKDDREFTQHIIDALRRGSSATKVPDWIYLQPLQRKYPQESEDMLTRTILGKKIPIGGLGVDIGVLILDIQSVIRVCEAVAEGKPFIERTVALAGSACKEHSYINIRIGTSLKEVLEGNLKEVEKFRAIFGGTMAGLWQKDLSITVGRSIGHITVLTEQAQRQFLAFMRPGGGYDSYSYAFLSSYLPSGARYDTNMHGELRPCIQCGYCEEVCPVSIVPHYLSKHIRQDICDGLEKLGIFECIDCGLCSYVCPSKIPLCDDIVKGKKRLIEEGCPVPMVKVKESEEAVKAYRGRMPL